MSSEVELKFRIPAARLAAVRRAVVTRGAQVEPLAAAYFDTPGDHLARARVALRLRREGSAWVQTLKAEGADAMQRLEHNVPVPGARRPGLDLGRHDGSEAGTVLRRALADARDQPLRELYATEVRRTRRVLRQAGARIELALDEGRITAAGRSLAICELEFELLDGPPQALLALAARWVDRFGLVLDVRSKSERGHQLARQPAHQPAHQTARQATRQPANALAAALPMSPPTMARPLQLPPQAGLGQALAAMLADPLGQALANASQMAEGPAVPEHLHQLRVGLRRMRSVLQVFAPLPPGGAAQRLSPALQAGPAAAAATEADPPALAGAGLAPALAALFGQLGAARDRDAMAEWLLPALRAAGAPPMAPLAGPDDAEEAASLARLLCAPATQRLWLDALAACQPPGGQWPLPAGDGSAALKAALREPLQRLMRQVQRDAARFAELDDQARHRLRRRIKRLRYAAESVASLWPAAAVARTLRQLRQAQTPLGEYNDTVVAQAHCRAWAEQEPHAWFAVGWLAARRVALVAPCQGALARLARSRAFWC